MFYEVLSYSLFILMFIISGFLKVKSFGYSEAARLGNKIGVNLDTAAYIVLFAGIWELVSSMVLGYGVFAKDKKIKNAALISLFLFTSLATLIFYSFPINYKPLLSNLSVLGAIAMIVGCA